MQTIKKEVNPRVIPNSDVLPFFGQKIRNTEQPASKREIINPEVMKKAREKYGAYMEKETMPFS